MNSLRSNSQLAYDEAFLERALDVIAQRRPTLWPDRLSTLVRVEFRVASARQIPGAPSVRRRLLARDVQGAGHVGREHARQLSAGDDNSIRCSRSPVWSATTSPESTKPTRR